MIKKIEFITIDDIKEFVDIASRYGDTLCVKSQHYIVPACSLIGVMSLDLSKPVKLSFENELVSAISLDFKKWLLEER